MKYLNIIGGMLCVLAIWIGSHAQPGPTPDPTPVVVEEKGLIDADGLYVLIVEEKDDRRNLPVKQASVLVPSSQLTGWFADHQVQWRRLDTNSEDMSQDDPKWQKALADLKRDSLPWIYIQIAGKQKFSGPLPGSVDDTLALLAKHSGVTN